MPLFRKQADPAPLPRTRIASGVRVDPGDRKQMDSLRLVIGRREDWQGVAWAYRDAIGQIRFAANFLARAVAAVKFNVAQVMPEEDEPIALTEANQDVTDIDKSLADAARAELERLPLTAGYMFGGLLAENFEISGEAWLNGRVINGVEQWRVLAYDQVLTDSAGGISIREEDGVSARPVSDDEDLIRLWVPHPRRQHLADSPMRSLLNECEDYLLLGRELRAVSRSRISSNGILFLANGMRLGQATTGHGPDGEVLGDDETGDPFMDEFTQSMMTPMALDGDAGSVVPTVITGDRDDIVAARHMRFEREDSETLLAKKQAALAAIAQGLDVPPEIITGMGDANHWSAWQIDASTFRYHIAPVVKLIADSLTEGYLRPALITQGFTYEQVQQIQVWFDAGAVTENPNRGSDAKDAYDRGGIGRKALNKALGFNDSDMPDEEELAVMIALKAGVDTGTAANLLKAQGILDEIAQQQNPVPAPLQVPSERADQPAPGETPPDDGTPVPPPQISASVREWVRSITAAADSTTGWRIDTEIGRDLADIDKELLDKILVAADAAMERALEKAGAKLRSAANRTAQNRAAYRAELAQMDGTAFLRHVGRIEALKLGLDELSLLEAAFDAMAPKVLLWTKNAIKKTVLRVLSLLGLTRDSDRGGTIADDLERTLTARQASAWNGLRDALIVRAQQYLYQPHPDKQPGEVPDTITRPGDVRDYLTAIGTDQHQTDDIPLGLSGGADVQATLTRNGAEQLGYQWRYGITDPEDSYHPHRDLDGTKFTNWTDDALRTPPQQAWVGTHFRPGDHPGCMCNFVMTWAIPEHDEALASEVGVETEGMRQTRELAEHDDAENRTGTAAQRTRDTRKAVLALQERWLKG